MAELAAVAFRTVAPSGALPEGLVVAHYLADRKAIGKVLVRP